MITHNDEIEKLKKDWLSDPCWDLEDTEGFEAHRDELKLFRLEQEARWEAARESRLRDLAERHGCPPDTALGARINHYDAILIDRTEAAQDLLVHYFGLTDFEAKDEVHHLVQCLVEAASAKTLRELFIEQHQR